jgi:transposase InsO family protein
MMKAEDVTDTSQLALIASGCDQARVIHKPLLLSDNGSSYVSADLAEWLKDNGMRHVREHLTIRKPSARSSVGTRP